MKTDPTPNDSWIADLVQAATETVVSYEKYLLDEIDHAKLAKVMKRLRSLLALDK